MNDELRSRLYRDYLGERVADPQAALARRAAYLTAIVEQHFPADRDATVLDLGCGYGALLYFAGEAGYRQLIGVDVSKDSVALAHSLGIEGVREGMSQDVLAELAPESVDLVVCFDQLEHLSKDELPGFTDAVHRVLKVGGRWLIHVPNGASPFAGAVRYGDLTHELAFTPGSLRHWLEVSGFEDVRCFEEGPVAHGLKSALRWLLWRPLRALIQLAYLIETGSRSPDGIVSQNFLCIGSKHA